MQKLTSSIVNFLFPKTLLGKDPEVEISEKIFAFILAMLGLLYTYFSIQFLIIENFSLSLLNLFISFSCLTSWYIYRYTEKIVFALNFLFTITSISAIFRIYYSGGINSPVFFMWTVIPLSAVALAPKGWAFFWTSIYMSIALCFDILSRFDYSFETQVSEQALQNYRIFGILAMQAIAYGVMSYVKMLNRKHQELIALGREKETSLVRIISHDIASPLSIISLNLQRLEKNPSLLDEKKLASLIRASNTIEAILRDVRELEAIRSGKKEVQLTKVYLDEVIEDIQFLQKERLTKKNITFNVDLEFQGLCILAEKDGFTNQVLNNLISNSVKFSEDGETISIKSYIQGDLVRIRIEDHGIGIPKQTLENLFDATKPTTRLGTQGEKGTGFGMPIVKSYLERYNAQIFVESRTKEDSPQNHGTVFIIDFPLPIESEAA